MARRSRPLFPHSSPLPASRKGFELAIGTIVILVLGILVVGGGLVILLKIQGDSTTVADKLTAEQRTQLKALVREGQLVAVYPSSQKVKAGTSATFGLLVENRLDADKTFDIEVSVERNGVDQASVAAANTVRITKLSTLTVKQNDAKEAMLVATAGKSAPQGEYVVFVKVKNGADTYDSVRFFTVYVP